MYKVYGPYTRKDGRKHVIHYDGKNRRTQSYPRYLMEKHLERTLLSSEHVDHINNDHTDDRIENLQLLSPANNNRKSSTPALMVTLECKYCKKSFKRTERQHHANHYVQGKDGPFCSKRCAGKVHH